MMISVADSVVSLEAELIDHDGLRSEHVDFANVSGSRYAISFCVLLVLVHDRPKPAEQDLTVHSPDLQVPA